MRITPVNRLSTLAALLLAAAVAAPSPALAQQPKPESRGRVKRAAKAPVANAPSAKKPAAPAPTLANVPYGDHPKQVLDFWRAESSGPAPLVFFIHGGGWTGGDRGKVTSSGLADYLAAGISVVSVEYRFVPEAIAAGVEPPVQWPLHDAARALQFVRSQAAEWNIDKTRVGASGGSAGACSSLWLAFHDDLADSQSEDPIARESTRLTCAGVTGAQTTLDPHQMREWTPNSRYGGHAFGFVDAENRDAQFQKFFDARDQILPWIQEYSPYALVSTGDPPVYLAYGAPPALGKEEKDPTHTANFGVKLQERCREAGVTCQLVYPGAADVEFPTVQDFLIAALKRRAS